MRATLVTVVAHCLASVEKYDLAARPVASAHKRKGQTGGSPPRKFTFAAQKPKDMQL